MILLTGCGATIEVRPEQVPGRTTRNHPGPGHPVPVYPVTVYPGPVYPGSVYPGSVYPGSVYPGSVSYPGDYQSNYPSHRHDSARGSSFSLKITPTR